jgi:hypothetical protein
VGDEALLGLDEDAVGHGVADDAAEVEHRGVEAVVQVLDLGCEVVVRDGAVEGDGLSDLEVPDCLEREVVDALERELVISNNVPFIAIVVCLSFE